MKKKFIITGILAAVAITASLAAQSNRFLNVRYTTSAAPNACLFPASRPDDCNTTTPGTICRLEVGSLTYTYYQFSSCVTPWYRPD